MDYIDGKIINETPEEEAAYEKFQEDMRLWVNSIRPKIFSDHTIENIYEIVYNDIIYKLEIENIDDIITFNLEKIVDDKNDNNIMRTANLCGAIYYCIVKYVKKTKPKSLIINISIDKIKNIWNSLMEKNIKRNINSNCIYEKNKIKIEFSYE